MKSAALLIFFLTLFLNGTIRSQSSVNPDISLIGSFNTFSNFIKDSPDYKKLIFDNPAMELFVDGYLNPFARAAGVVSYEENKFSIEELYAEVLRGLPLDIQLKAGKFLVGFGKINTLHPHAWPFLERPLFHQIYFGDEGFNDIGLNLSFLLPTGDIYTNLDLGIFKGDAIGKSEAAIPDDPESIRALRGNSPVFAGRLGSFFNISDYSDLEVGMSGSFGVHAKTNIVSTLNPSEFNNKSLYYTYGGIDFKFKYKPDSYTSLTLQGEVLLNHRDVFRRNFIAENRYIDAVNQITTIGSVIYFDYRFSKIFSLGAKYDFTYGLPGEAPSYNTLSNDDRNKTHGISEWIGYYPVEETLALRLGAQHLFFSLPDNLSADSQTTITLQLLFSLGPHKAHPF
ncbi:MAG: hypothetical protein ACM34K_21690 [Bacillota bacterium]